MSQNRYVIIIPKTITTADNFIGHPPGGAHPIFIMAIKGRSHFALSGFFYLCLFYRHVRIIFPQYFINYFRICIFPQSYFISVVILEPFPIPFPLTCQPFILEPFPQPYPLTCPCVRPLVTCLPMCTSSLRMSSHVYGVLAHVCPCRTCARRPYT